MLLIIAESGAPYNLYDEKSVAFIEEAINLVDMKFQGIERIKVPVDDIESGEKKDIEIKYFKSVKSSDRIYHKF